jgi:microcystin-dependent protein
MAIDLTGSRIQYVAGTLAQFSIPFIFENESDISVYQNETKLGVSAYTVTGAGIDPYPSTRFITIDPAPTSGDIITIMRDAEFERTTDFTVSGNFSAVNVNQEFDRLVLMMQQLNTMLNELGLQYPDYVDDSSGVSINRLAKLPANTGTGIPVWTTNAAGDLINGLIDEDSGCSTLRSELINNDSGTAGSKIVGYYDIVHSNPTTVSDALDTLNNAVGTTSFHTGMLMPYCGSTAPTGWILCDGGTIGTVASGADNNLATMQDLFEQLWSYTTSSVDWLPIYDSVGAFTTRGASATADWNANKRLALPQIQGKTVASVDQMIVSATFTVLTSILTLENVPAAAASFPSGSAVQVTTTGTFPSGLAAATNYYVIGVSTSTIKLAATQDEAVKDTPASITIGSTHVGTLTLTRTLGSKSPCQWAGEDEHLIKISEMPAHTHTYNESYDLKPQSGGSTNCYTKEQSEDSGASGGSNAVSMLQPTIYTNWIIKI